MDYCGDLTNFQCLVVDIGLWIGYIFIALTALASIVFPVVHTIKNPGGGKGSLVFVGGLVVVFLICWVLSSGDISSFQPKFIADFNLTEGVSKLIGGSLLTFYVLAGMAVLLIIYSEVSSWLKFR